MVIVDLMVFHNGVDIVQRCGDMEEVVQRLEVGGEDG